MNALTSRASNWLAQFAGALERCGATAAADMFLGEYYWRDLVAFTWNIVALEGQASIRAMLAARLGDVRPVCWEIDGEASEGEAGVVEAWF